MPQVGLRDAPYPPKTSSRFGADLRPSEPGSVVVPQRSKPPLRFKGRRLTQHWRRIGPESRIIIELWERKTGGFVVSHSDYDKGTLQPLGQRCATLSEAISYLEGRCKEPAMSIEEGMDLSALLAEVQRQICFGQHFAQLAGDVLADWTDRIDEIGNKK